MHVPGHERDNLAYYASDFGILVSGSYLRDIKGSWTYSVQGGGLSAVKKTFDRLEKLKFHVALPNHGRPLLSEDEVRKAFDRARDMLAIRDRSILKAVGKGPRSFTALLKEFPAIPRLHPWYMERIMLAHLVALQETGAVEKFGETWRRL
jgi:glyoxylase-like metal-dependent hydrolase (beta-lactamase superfamily II)